MHLRQRRVGPRGADTAGRRDDAAGAVRAEARVAEQQTVFATATRRPGRARALALAFAFAFALAFTFAGTCLSAYLTISSNLEYLRFGLLASFA